MRGKKIHYLQPIIRCIPETVRDRDIITTESQNELLRSLSNIVVSGGLGWNKLKVKSCRLVDGQNIQIYCTVINVRIKPFCNDQQCLSYAVQRFMTLNDLWTQVKVIHSSLPEIPKYYGTVSTWVSKEVIEILWLSTASIHIIPVFLELVYRSKIPNALTDTRTPVG